MGVVLFDKDSLLNLNKEYSFTVRVQDQDKTLAGKLFLAPSKCTLHVTTERKPSDGFYDSQIIYCSSTSKSFILYDLVCTNNSAMFHLQDGENHDSNFYEYIFEVQFIVLKNGFLNFDEKIINFTFDAQIFKKWVGHTKTQNNLISKLINNELINADDLEEFSADITDYAQILIHYELQQQYSAELFSVGANFPPKLTIFFKDPKSISELHFEFNKIYELVTFLVGSDFKIDMINIETRDNHFSKSSVYFPTSNIGKEVEYPLLPLNHNLIHSYDGLVELPLESFNNFYRLDNKTRILFTKYLRYKRMKSDEEKFLGFFRLLEKLTFKSQSYVDGDKLKEILEKSKSYLKNRFECKSKVIKDFSTRIERTNEMKYNTLKCLLDFYDILPKEITNKLLCQRVDLEKITALRNNITHANHYIIDDASLYKYTRFINSLLVLAFMSKLEIPIEGINTNNLNYFLPHN